MMKDKRRRVIALRRKSRTDECKGAGARHCCASCPFSFPLGVAGFAILRDGSQLQTEKVFSTTRPSVFVKGVALLFASNQKTRAKKSSH